MEEHITQAKTEKTVKETKTAKPTGEAAKGRPATDKRPVTHPNMGRPNGNVPSRQPNGAKPMDARALNKLSVPELTKLAVNYNIEDISGLRKQELIGRIVAVQAKQNGPCSSVVLC